MSILLHSATCIIWLQTKCYEEAWNDDVKPVNNIK